MTKDAYHRKQSAIYTLEQQLEDHTDKFWARCVKIAKEVCGEFYQSINFANYHSDSWKGLFESVSYQESYAEAGKGCFVNLIGKENFRGNSYHYYYTIPEDMFWSDDDSLIRAYFERKLQEYKDSLVKRAELELNRKKQEFEKLKQELNITT